MTILGSRRGTCRDTWLNVAGSVVNRWHVPYQLRMASTRWSPMMITYLESRKGASVIWYANLTAGLMALAMATDYLLTQCAASLKAVPVRVPPRRRELS